MSIITQRVLYYAMVSLKLNLLSHHTHTSMVQQTALGVALLQAGTKMSPSSLAQASHRIDVEGRQRARNLMQGQSS